MQRFLRCFLARRPSPIDPRGAAAWGVFALLLMAGALQAQTDDFNDGNDNGWTHYAPLGGSFTVTSGQYSLFSNASPDPFVFGAARVASLREDFTYTNFVESVDLINWDTSHDEGAGLLARVTNVGPGTSDGYAFSYASDSHEIDINVLNGEDPTNIAGTPLTLTPGSGYRLVFTGVGTLLTGSVYNLSNLSTPIATIHATDTEWSGGFSGLIAADSTFTSTASATFDNYAAAVPEPSLTTLTAWGAAGVLLRRRRPALIC